MFSATSLLVLACSYAIAVGQLWPPSPSTPSYQQCINPPVQTGTQTSHPVTLQPVPLPPYNGDYEVHVPDLPECPYGLVGAQAAVCDYDVAPSAVFNDLHTLKVHRNGALQQAGSVTVTVYC